MPSIEKYMTLAPEWVGPKMSAARALKVMKENHCRHIPVEIDGKLVGLVSDRDIELATSVHGTESLCVSDVMICRPYTASLYSAIDEVALQMAEHKYSCAVVQDSNGKVVGIFTAVDAFRVLNELLKDKYKKTRLGFLSALVILIIVAFSTFVFGELSAAQADETPKASMSPIRSEAWSLKMQELYRLLAPLLTDVTSDKRFNNPKYRSRIEHEAERLSSLVHNLNEKEMNSGDADPTIQIVAGMLGKETKKAVLELQRGNFVYARTILRSVPSFCIACHTRNSTGPQLGSLPLEPSNVNLSHLELGQFFSASRQFDRAQKEFLQVIREPNELSMQSLDWENAVHQSLTIAVRVKNNPVQAKEIIQMISDTPNAPSFMKEDAKTWITSVSEWQSEATPKALNENTVYAEVIRLMAKARETQKYPMDRTADIIYLRASAAVHNLLQMEPKGPHSEEALLLAGLSYEVLSPLKMEDLHELFYETCVRRAPHTSTANLCYQRLEADVIFEYTGSIGTNMPDDVTLDLKELQKLSSPMPALQN